MKSDESQDLGIVDGEDRLGVGDLGPEHEIQQPFVGGEGPALEAQGLLAAQNEQGVSRHGVQGFHAPAFEHGNVSEAVHVEATHLAGRECAE